MTSTLPSTSHLDNIIQVTSTTSLTQGLTNMLSHSSQVLFDCRTNYQLLQHRHHHSTPLRLGWRYCKPNYFYNKTTHTCTNTHIKQTTLLFYILSDFTTHNTLSMRSNMPKSSACWAVYFTYLTLYCLSSARTAPEPGHNRINVKYIKRRRKDYHYATPFSKTMI